MRIRMATGLNPETSAKLASGSVMDCNLSPRLETEGSAMNFTVALTIDVNAALCRIVGRRRGGTPSFLLERRWKIPRLVMFVGSRPGRTWILWVGEVGYGGTSFDWGGLPPP